MIGRSVTLGSLTRSADPSTEDAAENSARHSTVVKVASRIEQPDSKFTP